MLYHQSEWFIPIGIYKNKYNGSNFLITFYPDTKRFLFLFREVDVLNIDQYKTDNFTCLNSNYSKRIKEGIHFSQCDMMLFIATSVELPRISSCPPRVCGAHFRTLYQTFREKPKQHINIIRDKHNHGQKFFHRGNG